MAARRILKLAVLILLLVWEPGLSPDHEARRSSGGGTASIDVGFRIDPEHPWTSWRLYVDFRPGSGEVEPGPEERSSYGRARAVEVGPSSLVRAAGGATYILLRGGLESLLRDDRTREGR